MTQEGLKRLLAAVEGGKGFVAFHAASDSFHSQGGKISPYLAMLGGEFVTHQSQQKATMKVVSPNFPGVKNVGDSFEMLEEWYAQNHFAKDLHVILVQETRGHARRRISASAVSRHLGPHAWQRPGLLHLHGTS